MSPEQFRRAIAKLGVSQRSFAKLIHEDERKVRKWLAGENRIPHSIVVLVRLLLAGKVEFGDIERAA